MTKKEKTFITTGEAAAIFNVDPDSILRWIKSGKIPAIRTPGGHYRINRNIFLTKMIENTTVKVKNSSSGEIPYCWEYNSESGITREACRGCLVYRSKAARCNELCNLPKSTGEARLFCTDSCNDCQYFNCILQYTS